MKGISLLLTTAVAVNAQAYVPKRAAPVENPAPFPTLFRRQQFQEPCEEVSASWSVQKAKATGAAAESLDSYLVPAQVAYECLQSVPVDVQGDIQQIKELKEFLQFQSTLSWLKQDQVGQIEPLDLMARLDEMAEQLRAGGYQSEYNFQNDIKVLFDRSGDFHLRWNADILEPMYFGRAGGSLTLLSKDGLSLPEIYLVSDIAVLKFGNYTASPLKTINGQDAVQYLYNISDQATYHDPDARFNRLFLNKARYSFGLQEIGPFAQAGLYDGPTTELTFANGTKLTLQNIAHIPLTVDFTNVTDGQSFFNTFCQGPPQSSATSTPEPTPEPTPSLGLNATSIASATPSTTPTAPGYPNPVFIQSSRSFHGYYLNGTGYDDVTVLAIPDFGPKFAAAEDDPDLGGARETQQLLRAYFAQAVEQKKTRLVIDLRGNGGGTIDVGFEVFKQLFPTVEPYGGARYRANDALKIYSTEVAAFAVNQSLAETNPKIYDTAINSELAYQNIVNVNYEPFTSFADYWPPDTINGDNFTAIRRYNFSNHHGGYTSAAGFNLTGYLPEPTPPQPFQPENIVIIQDGLCGSTCAIFAELMREQAKVQTIFVGGRPMNGPAQGVGGSKGSQVLPMGYINTLMNEVVGAVQQVYGIEVSKVVNSTAVAILADAKQLIKRSAHGDDDKISGAVNSLNNLRQNDTTETPLEFIYEAADCRLFDTVESFISPVPLWKRAVDAKWGNGKCVDGSMGDKTAISVVDNKPFNKQAQANSTGPDEYQGAASGLKMSRLMVALATVAVAAFLM